MNKKIKKSIIALIIASFFVIPMAGVQGGAQAQGFHRPDNAPSVSEVGVAQSNIVPTLVIVADTNPAMRGIRIAPEPKVQAAIEAAVADPDATNALFSFTFKAAGTSDPWGAVCKTFPAAAQTAFNAAAAIWTATIQSSVPIAISACWSSAAYMPSANTLGYSGGAISYRDFTGAPKTGTWYESSLANALYGSDLDSSAPDDYITYNSDFSWYTGTDGLAPTGQYDLVTVAAHEIAHGLNFSGTAKYSAGSGSFGNGGYPNVYDTFMENSTGTKLITYTNPSANLGSLLTSGSLWFNGVNANAANGGSRVKIYAPGTWAGGSSYAHLDYNTFAGTINSMMVYAVNDGASNHNPGPVTKGLLKDLGWVMAGATPTNFTYLPLVIKNIPPTAGFWQGTAEEFYVTPNQANVDKFAVYIDVTGCESYKITHTALVPIASGHFSFTGTFSASGTFDSATSAHGTEQLSSFVISGCGTVSGGPWSWTATWQNSSQPIIIRNEGDAPSVELIPELESPSYYHAGTIDK